MRIATRGLRVVSVGLVSAVLLAGCSGNSSKPTVLPPLTTSATPAAATTPAPAPTTSPAPATSVVASTLAPTSAALTSEAPATTSATPSPTTTTVSAVDAANFVKTYYKTAADALHSKASLARWPSMYLSTCKQCRIDYINVSRALAAGNRYDGGAYHLVSQSVTDVESGGATIAISFFVTAGKEYNSKGEVIVRQAQTKTFHSTVEAQYTQKHWYIFDVQDAP